MTATIIPLPDGRALLEAGAEPTICLSWRAAAEEADRLGLAYVLAPFPPPSPARP